MLDGLYTRLTTTGMRQALRLLGREVSIQRHHRSAVRRARQFDGADLRLNVGCGPNRKPGMVNIDLVAGADLRLDLREPLPFRDNSAVLIYSEHVLEHLNYPGEALRFLGEARRVLRPGGIISTGVPDAALILGDYVAGDDAVFAMLRARYHPAWCATRLDSVNYFFRQDGDHRAAYDADTLTRALTTAGFVAAARRPFDPALDSEARREGTLYVDAVKPPPATI